MIQRGRNLMHMSNTGDTPTKACVVSYCELALNHDTTCAVNST